MSLRKFFLFYSMVLLCLLVIFFGIYRSWVVLPKLQEQQLFWQQKEVLVAQQALLNELSQLKTINYDYAVWDESYDFMQSFNQDYIDSNFLPDTFHSLKIDGSYFFDDKGKLVWGKGFDRNKLTALDFPELIINGPNIAQRLVIKSTEPNVIRPGQMTAPIVEHATVYGAIASQYGVVFFSATQIKKSNRSGDNAGFLVFLQLLRPDVLMRLSQLTGMQIEGVAIAPSMSISDDILAPIKITTLASSRQYFLGDMDNKPVMALTLHHSKAAAQIAYDLSQDSATLIALLSLGLFPLSLLWAVNVFLVKPLEQHTQSINDMGKEQGMDFIQIPSHISELNALQAGFNELVATVNQQQKILSAQATEDALTGIANRRVFESFYDLAWRSMVRNETPLALIICDIDHFKLYNDHYGHAAGDQVLKVVAKALRTRFCRATDLLARYGGEEFVIVLTNVSLSECELNAQAVLHLVNSLNIPHAASPVSSHITVSLGMTFLDPCQCDTGNIDPLQLFLQTDRGLYRAKNKGRNGYVVKEFDEANPNQAPDTLNFM